jgi:hypothetical protein
MALTRSPESKSFRADGDPHPSTGSGQALRGRDARHDCHHYRWAAHPTDSEDGLEQDLEGRYSSKWANSFRGV